LCVESAPGVKLAGEPARDSLVGTVEGVAEVEATEASGLAAHLGMPRGERALTGVSRGAAQMCGMRARRLRC